MATRQLSFSLKHCFIVAAVSFLVFKSNIGEIFSNLDFDFITKLSLTLTHSQLEEESVVVVGIDENSLQAFPEPLALWHQHIADFISASKKGQAKIVGLDIILPEQSFDFIKAGIDDTLIQSIVPTADSTPVILAKTIDSQGHPRKLHTKFEVIAGEDHIGYALFPIDQDGVIRRFSEQLTEDNQTIPTLVGQLLRISGKQVEEGYIDFTVGKKLAYVPIHEIIQLFEQQEKEKLNTILKGKIVLLGTVLPAEDRVKLPINIASWEENNRLVPGVLLHAQTLKSILAKKMIVPINNWYSIFLIVICTFVWTVEPGKIRTPLVLFGTISVLIVCSFWLFKHGYLFPLGILIFTLVLSSFSRVVVEAIQKFKERALLRKTFSGAVSPALMSEILAGKFNPKLGGERVEVCVLFADIRGFTTLSEENSPEYVISLLNRYFEGVVDEIHQQSGVVLCFMGDGIMAVFGAPKPLVNPELFAYKAAKGMHAFVSKMNAQLNLEGKPPIRIGVGIHSGEAIIGQLGSSTRNDYTVIGDVANLASRLEGMTKDLNCGIAFSESVNSKLVTLLESEFNSIDYGVHQIKGRSPERIFGCPNI